MSLKANECSDLRKQLAQISFKLARMQRTLEETPGPKELEQYQKRIAELDDQMAHKFSEQQQFYTLFNTLEAQKVYLSREIKMLVSVQESLPAIASSGQSSQKAYFLQQMQGVLLEVTELKTKLNNQLKEEERLKQQETQRLQELLEDKRKRYLFLRDLNEEKRLNEELREQIRAMEDN